jgi:hypothetical protein
MANTLHALRLDPDDEAILEALCKYERLTQSDIIRRAIRHYAHELGVVDTPKVPKVKPRKGAKP